jgi:ABC-type multidrug transport system fused ATPase/permease subunit
MAILGEMTMLPGDGKLLLPKYPKRVDEYGLGGVSYTAQAPFLQHQSIRDNILFGTPYDEQRYEAVLESCALNPDLAIFEERDLTEVGSRGISLSGGQKARVALARAVYARSRCVLLDDPLSAVVRFVLSTYRRNTKS